MQALNHAIHDASLFRDMLRRTIDATPTPPAQTDSIDAWNDRVDRERFDKARARAERRSATQRLTDPL